MRRFTAALLAAEPGLRAAVLQEQQYDEETREVLLEALRKASEPYQQAVRAYLRTIYEADTVLVTALKEAEEEVSATCTGGILRCVCIKNDSSLSHPQRGKMDQALAHPIDILDAVRYAHRMRPVASAPKGWQPGVRLDFVPPNPYMPVNECIAASRLRQHHLEVQRANRGMYAPQHLSKGCWKSAKSTFMCKFYIHASMLYTSRTAETTATRPPDTVTEQGQDGEGGRSRSNSSRRRGRSSCC